MKPENLLFRRGLLLAGLLALGGIALLWRSRPRMSGPERGGR